MKKIEQIQDPVKFSLIAGSILLALPTFFWIGVILEIIFKIPFIVTKIMLPVDRLSPLLSVMIMVGLPVMAILINLKSMLIFHMDLRPRDIEFDFRIKRNFAQWMLIIYASISIVAIMSYAFFENFKIISNIR